MLTGMPFAVAGGLLNLVLAGAAAVLIWAVLRSGVHADRQPQRERLALVAACLWCFYPTTAVMLKPYTEALAVALVAGALLLLVRRSYLLVALVALPLGFTRGIAPALGAAVLIHLVVRWREDRAAGARPLDGPAGQRGRHARRARGERGRLAGRGRPGHRRAHGLLRRAGRLGAAPRQGALRAVVRVGLAGQGPRRGRRARRARRHLRRARARPARPVDLHRGAGLGAGLPALPVRGGAPDHQHVAVPAPRLPAGRAAGLGRDAHGQRPGRRAALAAQGRGGARWSSSAGLFWWTCSLLVYTPWGSFPP